MLYLIYKLVNKNLKSNYKFLKFKFYYKLIFFIKLKKIFLNKFFFISKNIIKLLIFNSEFIYFSNNIFKIKYKFFKKLFLNNIYIFYKNKYFDYNEIIYNKNKFKLFKIKNNKFLITEWKNFKIFTFKNYKFYKLNFFDNLKLPLTIKKTNWIQILHKYISTKKINLINYLYTSNSPLNKEIINQLKLYFIKNSIFISFLIKTNNYLQNIFSNYNFSKKAEDITYGLQIIETIFENKWKNYNYLIIDKGNLIFKISNTIYNNYNFHFINKFLIYNEKNLVKWLINLSNKPLLTLSKISSIYEIGSILNIGNYNPQLILTSKYNSLYIKNNQYLASKSTFNFIQNIITESLIKQYLNNNIKLSLIHFEIIVKKMTSFVKIIQIGNTTFNMFEILPLNLVHFINLANNFHYYKSSLYKPVLLGISRSILAYSSFFTSISFQETTKMLIKAALENKVDWLINIKTKIIISDLIPSGSGWYRYFNKN